MKIEAIVNIDGTIYNRAYWCDDAHITMYDSGLTVILFDNGRDDKGPVTSVGFAIACEVLKRGSNSL